MTTRLSASKTDMTLNVKQWILRIYAVIALVTGVIYLTQLIGESEFFPAAIGSAAFFAALVFFAEFKPIKPEVRAVCSLVLLLVLNFYLINITDALTAAPLSVIVVTFASAAFLNKRILATVTAVWNVLIVLLLVRAAILSTQLYALDYIFYIPVMELCALGAYVLIKTVTVMLEESYAMARISESASRAKTDFLANTSHEIRTPMNAIVGMTGLIMAADKHTPKDEIKDKVLQIKSAGQNLVTLIEDIMEISNIENGKINLFSAPYDVNGMITDVTNLCRIKLEGKPVSMLIDSNLDAFPRLIGDEHRVKQVLLNIISNAAKYTNQGHILVKSSVRLSEGGATLEVLVSDTGIGIKEADLAKLFKEFQRLDAVKNKDIEGTGLGLSITRRLVDAMGGEIKVTSEYGKGSNFTVIIPQKLPTGTDLTTENTAETRLSVRSTSVLVVDDNTVNLTVALGLFSLY
ncbi:MAG: hypothetical protein LBN25_04325, partial [Christensenellaceae bacterium]|nr:hypothetical protein [Christensenellaceae bacterium]